MAILLIYREATKMNGKVNSLAPPPPPSTHLLRDGGVKLEGNIHSRCLDSAVGKMTRPWAGCRRIHGLIHGRGKTLFLLQSV